MKKEYDFIFGLGNACSCTQTIRKAGLQFLSLPFDWIIMEDSDDLLRRVDIIKNKFRGWFEQKDLIKIRSYPEGNKDIYRNAATGTIFNHEFKMNEDLATRFPAVRQKYDRRIARFLELLDSAKRILIVRMDRPDQVPLTSEADCRNALTRLGALYPHAEFSLLHLTMAEGVAFRDRQVQEPGNGILRIAFDYRDTTPGVPPFAVNFDQTAAALSEVATVKDYRTQAEKRAYSDQMRRARWAKHGAKTWFGYILAKLKLA